MQHLFLLRFFASKFFLSQHVADSVTITLFWGCIFSWPLGDTPAYGLLHDILFCTLQLSGQIAKVFFLVWWKCVCVGGDKMKDIINNV